MEVPKCLRIRMKLGFFHLKNVPTFRRSSVRLGQP